VCDQGYRVAHADTGKGERFARLHERLAATVTQTSGMTRWSVVVLPSRSPPVRAAPQESALKSNHRGLAAPPDGENHAGMAEFRTAPCAAHNCLKPRWKDGWCAAHWYAHLARLTLQVQRAESLATCEAIWNAS